MHDGGVTGMGTHEQFCCAHVDEAARAAGLVCSPPLFKRPVRAARRAKPHMDHLSDEEEDEDDDDEEEQPAPRASRPRQHISGSQVAELARAGRERVAAGRAIVEGSAIKGPYDEQTWSTLVELGYAPTPAQGQPSAFRTPREFNPAAATPPLVHTDALAGKRTPPTGPQGTSPPMQLPPVAKVLSHPTPVFARKRSVADELAAAAASSAAVAQRAQSHATTGPSAQQSPADQARSTGMRQEPGHDAMAVLAAVAADSEGSERLRRQQQRHQEPFTPTSSAKWRAQAGPDREDALDGLVRPLLFNSPLLGLSPAPPRVIPCATPVRPHQQQQQHCTTSDAGRTSPKLLQEALDIVPPVVPLRFPSGCFGGGMPGPHSAPHPEVRMYSTRSKTACEITCHAGLRLCT